MFRKKLDLIIAALLPVCVLGIGFLVFSVKAAIQPPEESANPENSGPYYRKDTPDDPDDLWFGPEVQSNTLCAGQNTEFNHGFNIVETEENAWVYAATHAVDWDRTQDWTFGSATPWGTNSSYITLNITIEWSGLDPTNSTVGFPWNGTESHQRSGTRIDSWGEVTGWKKGPDNNWACPKYYKYIVSGDPYWYDCSTGVGHDPVDWIEVRDWQFSAPQFRAPGVLSRWADRTQRWHDCLDISG